MHTHAQAIDWMRMKPWDEHLGKRPGNRAFAGECFNQYES